MAVTLRNQHNPQHTLTLTTQTWISLLDLAEAYDFRPLGSMAPGEWGWGFPGSPAYDPAGIASISLKDDDESPEVYGGGLPVSWEDALHLAEALEAAFLDYEPLRVPASFYLFESDIEHLRLRPAVGTINTTAEFCRLGAFVLETSTDHTPRRLKGG